MSGYENGPRVLWACQVSSQEEQLDVSTLVSLLLPPRGVVTDSSFISQLSPKTIQSQVPGNQTAQHTPERLYLYV